MAVDACTMLWELMHIVSWCLRTLVAGLTVTRYVDIVVMVVTSAEQHFVVSPSQTYSLLARPRRRCPIRNFRRRTLATRELGCRSVSAMHLCLDNKCMQWACCVSHCDRQERLLLLRGLTVLGRELGTLRLGTNSQKDQ
eukprot:scaffold935_cov196-Alexandrium_tamarense.AAC.5